MKRVAFAVLGCEPVAIAAVFGLLAISLLPIVLVDIPVMGDYLNHVARMHLLVTAGTAEANPYYQTHWGLYPNLAMDLLVPPLAQWIGVAAATKAFLICARLLILTGAMAVEFAVKRKVEITGFVAPVVLFSAPFTAGLLNFEFGIGAALWSIAAWIILGDRRWLFRLAVHTVFIVGLFIAHFFAFGIYCATVGLFELSRLFDAHRDWKMVGLRFAILAGPATVPFVLMALEGGTATSRAIEWRFDAKLMALFFYMHGSNYAFSLVIVAIFAALFYFLFRERYLVIDPHGKWVAGGLLLLFVVMPFRVFGSGGADVRIPMAMILIVPGFIYFAPSPRWPYHLAVSIISLVIVAEAAHIAYVWRSYQRDYAEMNSSFALIKPGSFVLLARNRDDVADFPMYFAPTLAVHDAKALVPNLYTSPAQPVEVRSNFKHLDISDPRGYQPVPIEVLKAIANGRRPAQSARYLRNWQQDFGYLYVIGMHADNPMPSLLQEITAGRRFTLYRIEK